MAIGGGTTKVKRNEDLQSIAMRIYQGDPRALALLRQANGNITSPRTGTVLHTPPLIEGKGTKGMSDNLRGAFEPTPVPGTPQTVATPSSTLASQFEEGAQAAGRNLPEPAQYQSGHLPSALGRQPGSPASPSLYQSGHLAPALGVQPGSPAHPSVYQSGHKTTAQIRKEMGLPYVEGPFPSAPKPYSPVHPEDYQSGHLPMDVVVPPREPRPTYKTIAGLSEPMFEQAEYIFLEGLVDVMQRGGVPAVPEGAEPFYIPDEIFRVSGLGANLTDYDMVEMGWELTPNGRWVYNPTTLDIGAPPPTYGYGSRNYYGGYGSGGWENYGSNIGPTRSLVNWRGNTFG